jgi:hypothetical protein
MSCGITSGRSNPCLNSIGGLNNIYLFTYVNYRNFQIQVDDNVLVSYPNTTIYKYELRADANTFNTDLESNADGISYNQNANFQVIGLKEDRVEINALLNKRIGCIVENRLGQFFTMGLYNGVTVKSVKATSGDGRNTFTGYTIALSAKELNQPFFINDLQDAGFEIFNPDAIPALLQENGSYLLQENGFKILL